MKTKLAKIGPIINFKQVGATKYSQALKCNKSWWSRAWEGTSLLVNFSGGGVILGSMGMVFGLLSWMAGASGLMFGVPSGIAAASFVGLYLNSRRVKKANDKVLADLNEKFFFQLAQGVEAFNRRVTAWNGMLAALELGAEDRMSQEDKENIYRMLTSAREELARKVQLAEALLLPPCDHRPEVAAYLEELRDTERELPSRLAVPERALNQNNFQQVLENEVALFECAEEFRALPPKKD